jgi:hypothetical protein
VERGCAEVTAATTTSAASVHGTKTGRSFEAMPFVKEYPPARLHLAAASS